MAGAQAQTAGQAKAAMLEKKKASAELAKKRSKKLISNLLTVILVMTLIGAGLSSVGLSDVFLLIGLGLLPGIVARITDRRPGNFGSKTVIAFNIAGLSPHLAALLASGTPNQTALSIIGSVHTWVLIYGCAAFGWGVVYIIPQITHIFLEMRASYVIKKLSLFRKELLEEWGEDIKK